MREDVEYLFGFIRVFPGSLSDISFRTACGLSVPANGGQFHKRGFKQNLQFSTIFIRNSQSGGVIPALDSFVPRAGTSFMQTFTEKLALQYKMMRHLTCDSKAVNKAEMDEL